MKRAVLAAVVLFLPLFTPIAAAGYDSGPWDTLLKRHVAVTADGSATAVDYDGFLRERGLLRDYLAATSAVTESVFNTWSKHDQLAFLINAYNAWTIELVLSGYPGIESIKDLGSWLQSPWRKEFIPLLGKTRSLDEIEHEWIRAEQRYREPRIHFAVNCASIGCPALRNEAYAGNRLNDQLEDATRRFLSDRSRNRWENGRLRVSSIFKWYREDFERGWQGFQRLTQFLGRYAQALGLDTATAQRLERGQLAIDYLDYDWRLNRKNK